MKQMISNRCDVFAASFAAAAMLPHVRAEAAEHAADSTETTAISINDTRTFTKTAPPAWLLAFWKQIDDKTWGKGFDCFKEDGVAHLGVGDWHGQEAIRASLRAFVDKGFTAHHELVEFFAVDGR